MLGSKLLLKWVSCLSGQMCWSKFKTVFNVIFLKSQNEQISHYKTVAICFTSMPFTIYLSVCANTILEALYAR